MNSYKRGRYLTQIAEHYGIDHQVSKAIEECNELAEALEEMASGKGTVEHVVEEMADVTIMIEQLKILLEAFGDVEDEMDYKINRQISRMELEEKK